jgi:hypothetical protein
MAVTDIQILNNAASFESKNGVRAWDAAAVGAARADINRLLGAEFIELRTHSSKVGPDQYGPALYKLTEKGKKAATDNEVYPPLNEVDIIEAMSFIVGFDDIKDTIAHAIASRKRIHILLEGPPACAKSLFLEAVRNNVPKALMVFGSRTSGRGLSDLLFEKKPLVVLADELDKMRHDVFSLTLGLMEAGEIIETKSGNTRGVPLPQTMILAACNSSRKMPAEFLSRFAFHAHFPRYTREEFIDVVRSMLSRVEQCPVELSELIACQVFDNGLGDVRQARGVWQLMREPTREEVIRVLRMKTKYSPWAEIHPPKREKIARIPGL